jgi:addiction module HigA family antidote
MPMKIPPYPGEMVGDMIAEMGLTIVDAAKGLGVTRQQLHNLIAGRSAVSPEMAYRLEKAFGGTADAWLRLQASHDLAQVRARAASIKVSRLAPEVA